MSKQTIVSRETLTVNTKSPIKHNSIVAFKLPDSDTVRILRVIGFPGDEVEFSNMEVYLNKKMYKKAQKLDWGNILFTRKIRENSKNWIDSEIGVF